MNTDQNSVRRRAMILGWFSLVSALTWGSGAAGAQTRFQWIGQDQFSLAPYQTVEHCLALTARLRDSTAGATGIARDTMPFEAAELTGPASAYVTDIAHRCMARFLVDSLPLDTRMSLYIRGLLLANRDDDVARYLARRFAAIPDTGIQERDFMLIEAAKLYLQARPIRFAALDTLLEEVVRLGRAAPVGVRADVMMSFATLAASAGDSVRARKGAGWMVALPATFSDEERLAHAMDEYLKMGLLWAQGYLLDKAMEDSLRVSARTFATFKNAKDSAFLAKLKWPFTVKGSALGQQAPPLRGDYWFPRGVEGRTYPVAGKVNLVVFEDATWEQVAVMKRLKRRFPDLEMIWVRETRGYFGELAPPPPDTEATLMWKKAQVNYEIPVTLTVTRTEFWRLEAPDRRRIDEITGNTQNYRFGVMVSGRQRFDDGMAFLIDRDGTIVYSALITRWDEERWGSYIRIMTERGTPATR